MDEILGLGLLLFLGLLGGKISHSLGLPSVTGYILIGLFIGPSGIGIISRGLAEKLLPINSFALSFIALSIGGELKRERLHRLGRGILQISILESSLVFFAVTTTLIILGQPAYLGLLLGTLSMATAPGPLVAIIKEHRAQGPMSDTLLATTALDNLMTIILFGLVIAIGRFHLLEKGGESLLLLHVPLMQMVLSLFWGTVMSLLLHYSLTKSSTTGETMSYVLAIPLLTGGVASLFELSALLSLMVMGFIMANFSYENHKLSRTLDIFTIPTLIAFLTLGGVKLDTGILQQVGIAGIGAVLARILGKVVGARIGSHLSRLPSSLKSPLLGLGLTPKAGVSIGLAIIGEEKIPSLQGRLLAITLFMVIIFEVLGPPLTVFLLKRSGEID